MKPTSSAAPTLAMAGSVGSGKSAKARTRLVVPATSPLMQAIHVASASDTFLVRLLSNPHEKHAPSTARDGHHETPCQSPDQLSTTAPATIATMPNAIRESKFSRNTNHASSAV